MEDKDKNKLFFRLGLTIFLSLSATIVFFFLLFRLPAIGGFFGTIANALTPVFAGIAVAYILFPMERFFESHMKKLGKFARVVSVILTMLATFGILALFFALILPQLIESIATIPSIIEKQIPVIEEQLGKLNQFLESDSKLASQLLGLYESAETYAIDWVKNHLDIADTVSKLTGSLMMFGSALISTVLAVIVTVYLLLDHERYIAQVRKLFYAVSRNKRFNDIVVDSMHQVNSIFSGFISGKLVDSLLVGLLCFICLSIMNMPYALLVSVIVGVTNIIPMFGPFIGAVPSAFLILLVSPSKCLLFIIFIIVLQQVDGNIIGPRILGNSTGMTALYVTVAMLLFGKLLGFLGMIVGVPLFATLYYIVKRLVEHALRVRGLPVETEAYAPVPDPEPRDGEKKRGLSKIKDKVKVTRKKGGGKDSEGK